MGDVRHCAGVRKDGTPCTTRVLAGGRYCFAHAPELAERRTEARRRGGRQRRNAVRLRGLMPPRLVPIFDTLAVALAEVHHGDLDPKQAQAMASLARALVAVLTAGELEERVRKLEGGHHAA